MLQRFLGRKKDIGLGVRTDLPPVLRESGSPGLHRFRGQEEYERYTRAEICDACDGNRFRLISKRDRRGRPLDTVLCETCGLVTQGELPAPDALREFYVTQYRSHYHGQRRPHAHRIVRAWQGGLYYLNLLRPYLPPGADVCEIGAGLGATVKVFERAGFRAWGWEPGTDYLDYARTRLFADIRWGGWEDLTDKESIDVVLLIHVIEHLRSPSAALRQIWNGLRPAGRLYVECPDIAAPHSAPGRCFHQAHLYDFTPETLTYLALRNGFHVEHSFSGGGHVSLLLQKGTPDWPTPHPLAAARTLQGLHRYTRCSYYLRKEYWRKRFQRDITFLGHRFGAGRRVRRLEAMLATDRRDAVNAPETLSRIHPITRSDGRASVPRGTGRAWRPWWMPSR